MSDLSYPWHNVQDCNNFYYVEHGFLIKQDNAELKIVPKQRKLLKMLQI